MTCVEKPKLKMIKFLRDTQGCLIYFDQPKPDSDV